VFVSSSCANAQLTHSTWKGKILGDNPRMVILDFRLDSLVVYTIADSEIVEVMTYHEKNDELIVQKLTGQSDCDNNVIGHYKLAIQAGILSLKTSADPCQDRCDALNGTRWQNWKYQPEIQLSQSILKQYVGEYELNPEHHIFITISNGRLQAEGLNNGLPKSDLFAETNSRFLLKIAGAEIDFFKNDRGEVIEFISHEGKDYILKKIR
jgi:hypothetical protein